MRNNAILNVSNINLTYRICEVVAMPKWQFVAVVVVFFVIVHSVAQQYAINATNCIHIIIHFENYHPIHMVVDLFRGAPIFIIHTMDYL